MYRIALFLLCCLPLACKHVENTSSTPSIASPTHYAQLDTNSSWLNKSDEEWKKILPAEVYYIARQRGTEAPHTGVYNDFFKKGTYYCYACKNPLFTSESKFESHCGWPSFDAPLADKAIKQSMDSSHHMIRIEVSCNRCGAHLGHVFDDGPTQTGLRYCINSDILHFEAK